MSSFSNVLITTNSFSVSLVSRTGVQRTGTVFDERLERLVRLHRIRLDRLQVRLEDDELEVPPEVLQAAVRRRAALLLIRRLLCPGAGLFDGVPEVKDF